MHLDGFYILLHVFLYLDCCNKYFCHVALGICQFLFLSVSKPLYILLSISSRSVLSVAPNVLDTDPMMSEPQCRG